VGGQTITGVGKEDGSVGRDEKEAGGVRGTMKTAMQEQGGGETEKPRSNTR